MMTQKELCIKPYGFLVSTLVVLAVLIIVNIFYVVDRNKTKKKVAITQTEKFFVTDSDTQTIKEALLVSQSDEETQVSPSRSTAETNTAITTYTDTQLQTDLVYYVTLPDQLSHISEQLESNRKDLNLSIEWIGECEKMTLVATKAIDQQRQDLQELQKANHEHLYQELQHLRISLIQDIQFQLNLQAEAVEQNRICHQELQEACRPLWERLPYQQCMRSR